MQVIRRYVTYVYYAQLNASNVILLCSRLARGPIYQISYDNLTIILR